MCRWVVVVAGVAAALYAASAFATQDHFSSAFAGTVAPVAAPSISNDFAGVAAFGGLPR